MWAAMAIPLTVLLGLAHTCGAFVATPSPAHRPAVARTQAYRSFGIVMSDAEAGEGVATAPMPAASSGPVTAYPELGLSEDDMREGEDVTGLLAELARGDGASGEAATMDPVGPYVNAQALSSALDMWKKHDKDVGSSQVQVARLSERIAYLTTHLGKNRKDKAGERGLVLLANRRRRLLKYLINEDQEMFEKITAHYGIRTRKIVEESLGVTRLEKSRKGSI